MGIRNVLRHFRYLIYANVLVLVPLFWVELKISTAVFDVRNGPRTLTSETNPLKTVIAGSVHFFAAIGNLEEDDDVYKSVILIGWMENMADQPDLTCCQKYNSSFQKNNYSKIVNLHSYRTGRNKAIVFEIYCPLQDQKSRAEHVTLVSGNQTCDDVSNYLKVEYPIHHKNQLAICPKSAFGNLDPLRIIEWFEIQKILGVDMVVVLVMNGLNKPASNVLEFYRSRGRAHLYPYRTVHHKPEYMWPSYNVESKAILSYCWHTMKGYTYGSMLDFDEIIIPKEKGTIKDYILGTIKENPKVGSIFFAQKLFPLDTPSVYQGRSTFERYRHSTAPLAVWLKCVFLSDRTRRVDYSHGAHLKEGFKIYKAKDAVFHHYRHCPKYANCSRELLRYDYSIETFIPEVTSAIQALRESQPRLFDQDTDTKITTE